MRPLAEGTDGAGASTDIAVEAQRPPRELIVRTSGSRKLAREPTRIGIAIRAVQIISHDQPRR